MNVCISVSTTPGRTALTRPRLLTSATASSLVRKSQKGVMSVSEPSAKRARTWSWVVAPALAEGLLYLRDNREIVCLDVRQP